MAMHSYNLRSRVNSPVTSLRGTPSTLTPSSKPTLNGLPKYQNSPVALQLDHVIGTTTKNPGGLSSCPDNDTFAYCAGSVAVLAQVNDSTIVSRRYYRARPAAISLNPSRSYYATPNSTPTRKRRPLVTPRKEQENLASGRTHLEDENAKTWTARERIKSVKCVSLSPNGRFLAVGETGYNPRVLVFSTARDASSEVPLSIISEHTWGVKSVSFSPDSRFLATLGESNDGFLFLWSINPRTGAVRLCATNKCTTNICHMTWCGQHLITVGTRHVKVWQLPGSEKPSPQKSSRLRNTIEPSSATGPTPLAGRNCLLGDLANFTFTCAVAVSDQHAVICTDIGSLCLVDVSKNPAELSALDHHHFAAGALAFREGPGRLVWAGGGGELQEISVDAFIRQGDRLKPLTKQDSTPDDLGSRFPRRSALRQSLGLSQLDQSGTIAVSCLTKHTICIDTSSHLVLRILDQEPSSSGHLPLSSHNEPVQGVQALTADSNLGSFFTWSKNGEVRFWTHRAELLRIEQIELDEGSDVEDAASNELKVLRHTGTGDFISGDRFGVLKLTRGNGWELVRTARAHSAEVNDICIDGSSTFVATCSRDRMVQIFELQASDLDLVQTTDDHIAAVNQLTFSRDGKSLLSCSSDRTIVVREKVSRDHGRDTLVAFLQTRIITIKASPLSMCLVPGKDDILYVATLDRHVTKVDFTTGTILESFKTADTDADDHAVLNAIQVAPSMEVGGLRSLLIGCSSTDKSIRVYDLQKHTLISKESAHTEGISDLVLLENIGLGFSNRRSFVSTGHDSTIMIWTVAANLQAMSTPVIEITQEQASFDYDSDNTPAKASPATLPPLRKMLTKVDIAEFVKNSSPKSPLMRDPSPARLKRKGSKLALASSIEEADENTSPALTRRASADQKAKAERRSPSPPAYATRRQKKPSNRGEVTKDFFTRQSEWLRRSPSPQESSQIAPSKVGSVSSKVGLRRAPSVPTDLRARALAQERRSSTVPAPSDFGSINMASEQTCRMLRTYKKRLQMSTDVLELESVEQELEAVLEIVKKKKNVTRPALLHASTSEKTVSVSRLRLKRNKTSPTTTTISPVQSERKVSSSSTTGSETNSPRSGSSGSRGSDITEKASSHSLRRAGSGLGVDGLSMLLEKTKLVEA